MTSKLGDLIFIPGIFPLKLYPGPSILGPFTLIFPEGRLILLDPFKLTPEIAKTILKECIDVFGKSDDWSEDNLHQMTADVATKLEVKSGAVYTVMRIALSGVMVTPGGSVELMDILGKKESMDRLNKAYNWL